MLLRLPLKPHVPALAQQSVSPLLSVIVTVVLLKVERMCATPTVTLRRCFRLLEKRIEAAAVLNRLECMGADFEPERAAKRFTHQCYFDEN